mmetsp:Transcript_26611/g.86135  ORF Transcript_26611/g.86135 Transcript_26611/m.86135 type:complete len:231 (-) Transcript_26611:166-858(-)
MSVGGTSLPGECSEDLSFEHFDVVAIELRGFLVEGVVGVGFVEEVDEAVDDGVDVEDGLPVLAEDVEADVALEVDVRVEDARLAVDLGGFVGVEGRHGEGKVVGRALPEARVRGDDDVELRQVVWIRELDHGDVAAVELRDVLLNTDLTRRLPLLSPGPLLHLLPADAQNRHLLLLRRRRRRRRPGGVLLHRLSCALRRRRRRRRRLLLLQANHLFLFEAFHEARRRRGH